MLEIIRVENALERSQVDGREIREFPDGLRASLLKVLKSLKGVKKVHIPNETSNTILELAKISDTLDRRLSTKRRQDFVETIDLLRWYLAPRWRSSNPGAIGASRHCTDCNMMPPPGIFEKYCSWFACSSHEKWRAVIGPSYRLPEKPKFKPDPELARAWKEIEKSQRKKGKSEKVTDLWKLPALALGKRKVSK